MANPPVANQPPNPPDIAPITIEEEMRRSYLDYAMSVIVSRALPDVRDGLKPVHRRILHAMREGGYDSNKPYKKSARIVGDVMGKYHPHGDSSIYDAMVRMAQDFSMRLPLIDGQGNFGSMDGDPAAAMRYTEARLAKAAEAMLDDIDKNTVDFQANYDESTEEPTVLPSRFPNLLVNGAGGIAVGMATNIPTHNLGEVIDACCAYIDNNDVTIDELIKLVPGPDFPTGAIILGRSGCYSALTTGRGSIIIRAKSEIEEVRKDKLALVFTEIPYQVNKAKLLERIAEVVREKIIEGISDVRDESDRDGVRVVVELKRDAVADVVLNQLFRYTPLQTSFGANMLALNGGRPELLDLKGIIKAFVDFREQVITRRTEYELGKARERAHVLVGLGVAVANLDEMIELIRRAPDPNTARERMLAKRWPAADVAPLIELIDEPGRGIIDGTYELSETQARAILDLRLHRLTGLERDKIGQELREVVDKIKYYLEILTSRTVLMGILRGELIEMKDKFGTPRRTRIDELEFESDIEDLIQREDMVVITTQGGYIKRVPLSTYRAQGRGGKGRTGMALKAEDAVSDLFVANTHTPLLLFTSRGMVYKLKVWRLPQGTPQTRGKALVNLLPALSDQEIITAVMPLPEDESTWGDLNVVFATSRGNVRRNKLSDFANIRASGLIAMKLEEEGETLIAVKTCTELDDLLLATHFGKSIRFPVDDVRVFAGRTSTGVRGIRLAAGDEVISLAILHHIDATPAERSAYLKQRRKEQGDEEGETANEAAGEDAGDEGDEEVTLTEDRYLELRAREEFLLVVSEQGFGKRTSAYEYRLTGRGGQGIWAMDMSDRNKAIAACFPIADNDQVIMVSTGGQVIRMKVGKIRIAGRNTKGVTLFRVDAEERVVSVARLAEGEEGDEEGDTAAPEETEQQSGAGQPENGPT